MSLYGEYIQELHKKAIVEDEFGFATYFINKETKSCYIEDIYVVPEAREKHAASKYADKITEIAKEYGCDKLYGTVVTTNHNPTRSAKVLLAYGFKIDTALNNLIIFIKEIKQEN